MSIHNETKIEINEIEKIMDKFVKKGIAEAVGKKTQSGQTSPTYNFKYGIHEGNIITLDDVDDGYDQDVRALNLL
jgi:transcription initiation factor IIE alpha subunit